MKPDRARYGQKHLPWSTCPGCGKRSYESKGDARAAAKYLRSKGGKGLNVYACVAPGGSGWHVGHLPADIRAGKVSRRTVYGPKGDRP